MATRSTWRSLRMAIALLLPVSTGVFAFAGARTHRARPDARLSARRGTARHARDHDDRAVQSLGIPAHSRIAPDTRGAL